MNKQTLHTLTARLGRLACLMLLYAIGTGGVSATRVIFTTTLGTFEVELFDEEAPNTVANFLNYVSDGDYQNSFIHRSVPGFVIQGGGYQVIPELYPIPHDPPVVNEFGRSNLRGTIAMAKLAGDPNSATSEWFINLADNSANLDGQNGGFTVFGEVLGEGMTVVDAIADITTYNAGSPFESIPLTKNPGMAIWWTQEYLVMVSIQIDPDADDDGIADTEDNCPVLANPDQADNDADSSGDACDEDDDNDGLTDVVEAGYATDPLRADTDDDGLGDGAEVAAGRNPLVNEGALILLLGNGD